MNANTAHRTVCVKVARQRSRRRDMAEELSFRTCSQAGTIVNTQMRRHRDKHGVPLFDSLHGHIGS